MNKLRLVKCLVAVVLCVFFVVAPLALKNPHDQHLIIMGMIYGIAAMGWTLINRAGQFSLGQAAFLGIGAYTSMVLVMRVGLSFWLALPLSGIVAMAFAVMIGAVALRLRGLYFALVTFAFAEVVRLTIGELRFLGGRAGVFDIPPPSAIVFPFFGALKFTERVPFYYLGLLLLGVSAWVFWKLDSSRPGKIYQAIAGHANLAQSIGINIMKYRIQAFAVACFFTGVAGSFYAHYFNVLVPESFGIHQSLWIFLCAIVGGVSSIVFGPLFGAAGLTFVSDALRTAGSFEPLVVGALLMITCLYLPGGLVSIVDRIARFALGLGK